jgi:hypothetical protein
MTSSWKLQRSQSTQYKPQSKNVSLTTIIRLLASMILFCSNRGCTAFSNILKVNWPKKVVCFPHRVDQYTAMNRIRLRSTNEDSNYDDTDDDRDSPPIVLAEGLFAVDKPLDWTSSDVVSCIRGVLERDARLRGANPEKVGRRRKKGKKDKTVKCGHGGTLDPLASGVLVIGVGSGTKQLERCVHMLFEVG